MILEVEIPSDNYTLTLETRWSANGLIGDKIVAWGDNISTTGVTSHTYATAGRYVVKMHGYTSGNNYCHDSIAESLIEVVKLPYRDYNLAMLFNNCSKLTKVNMSNITGQIGYWFINCTNLTEVIAYNVTLRGNSAVLQGCLYLTKIEGMNTWDTSQVTSMANFFNGCSSLTEIDVSSFDTSNVTTMEGMFRNYGGGVLPSKLRRIIGIEKFNTSKVTTMRYMFQGQNLLTELNIGGWNTPKLNNLSDCFSGCSNLTSLDLSNWNLSNCTNFNYMFTGCSKLTTPPITTFGNADSPTTHIGYSQMYDGCTFTAKGITFKVVGACTLYRVFVNCKNLDSTITFEWNTDQQVKVPGLFCQAKNISVLGNFNLTSCVDLFNGFFFGGVGSAYNTNLTTFNCYGVQSYSLNISTLPSLSKESIMNIINCLCETTETLTLTLGSTNMAKLTEAEIAIATAKGWTVA